MAAIIDDDAGFRDILARSRTVAVLGAHPDMARPAHYVPAYLAAHGYRILPVNAAHAGEALFGTPVVARLVELDEPVDIVDVFRRSVDVPSHLVDILAMTPPPPVVWLQLGIRHDETAKTLVEAGIDVVQNRCMLAEHRRLFGAADPGRP